MNKSQQNYERWLQDAWKTPADETDDEVLKDGESIRVSMTLMDEAQRALTEPESPHAHVLDTMRTQAAVVQAHADRFTAEREAQDAAERAADTTGQLDYETRISNAWRHA